MTTATDTAAATDIGPGIEADNLTPEIVEGHDPSLAELIAGQLCSMHVLGGRLVGIDAVVDDGYIALEITRTEFDREADTSVRLMLHLSEPIPAAAGDSAEVGAPE